ncbi:hypothetical protein A0257_19865 [Hymenobacter psoromatis]|nr:hypothetical protein A0257_19865 [Hymenobacter psoromatis]
MNYQPAKGTTEGVPELLVLGSGCTKCWAAGYCAVFSPTSPTPPPACPLLLPAPRPPAPNPKGVRD